jgi:hypothetical protein
MADVTISSLPTGAPSGNGVIPFSLGGNTYQAPISGLFQNRPAFSAVVNQVRVRGPGVVPFGFARINDGNYNTTNFRYNIPYTGLYQINVFTNYIDSTAGQGASLYVRKNGNTQAGAYIYATSAGSGTWLNLAGSEVLNLNQGDYIDVYNSFNGYCDVSATPNGPWWSSFSGYFIG